METAAIILAAGAGTRMKSKKPKVVHEVLGRPLVRWVVEAAKAAGADKVVTVVGHQREQVIPLVEGDTDVAVQTAQRGTADAVLAAKEALADFGGAVVVLSGDSPLIRPEPIREMCALREEHDAAVVVLTMELENPFGYGRIVRDGAGEVARIVEQKDAAAEEAAITAQVLGNQVTRLYDVGVAGLHRTLAHLDEIMGASVIIAIAGMEGALASVIGGLADCPVVAVPTSVGYGASFHGLSALLSMLNSCASGVSVVNIDNGFGAGYLASMINHMGKGKG